MKTLVIIHEHNFGACAYFLKSNKNIERVVNSEPSEEDKKIFNAVGIDYEETECEVVYITEYNLNNIETLEL